MAGLFDHIGPTAHHAPSEFHPNSSLCYRRPVMEILPPEKVPINSFKRLPQQKANLIFSAISAKRGNLNLDLNLDLHGAKCF